MPFSSSISRAPIEGCEPGITNRVAFIGRDRYPERAYVADAEAHNLSAMLLAVDIGNTQTHIGFFESGAELSRQLATRRRMRPSPPTSSGSRCSAVLEAAGKEAGDIEGVIVSTVVPRLGPAYERTLRAAISARRSCSSGPSCAAACRSGSTTRSSSAPTGSSTRSPPTSASAPPASRSTSAPRSTSTPSPAAGEYLGGAIAPGLEVSIQALVGRAAKLPQIDLADPGRAIGRGTTEAIKSGFVYGFAGLMDGVAGADGPRAR